MPVTPGPFPSSWFQDAFGAAVLWLRKDQFRAKKTTTLAHGVLPQELRNGIIVTLLENKGNEK